MIKITKEAVFSNMGEEGSHRKQFAAHSGVQKNKDSPTFSVAFENGVKGLFEHDTGKELFWGAKHKQYYCFLRNQLDIELAEDWEERQGARVFIRNCLNSTMALDFNFVDNSSGDMTEIGALEKAAKYDGCDESISSLVLKSVETIRDVFYLRDVDYVCAIPASENKEFDLPRVLAERISLSIVKPDLTSCFTVIGKKKSLKECSLEKKWDAWEGAKITYEGPDLDGKSVLLVDDKYQSGTTMQFFGAKLQEQGVLSIHGFCMVKTLRDTDNVNVIES